MDQIRNQAVQCLINYNIRPGSSTVVFDINDTLVFDGNVPNVQMISLVKTAKQLGYKVILMTARSPNVYSRFQMFLLGVPYDELQFVPAIRKSDEKRRLKLDIVLSVGDRVTDLGASKYWIKLPEVGGDPRIYTNISNDLRNSCR